MEQAKRKGIIVWVYSLKQVANLKKFGTIHYQSRKMNYVVLYTDDIKIEEKVASIQRLHFVRHVEVSYMDEVDMTFKDALQMPLTEVDICE